MHKINNSISNCDMRMTIKTLSFSVWCRMHEERGKTARKTKPDAGMGDGWNKIQVRNTPCHCNLIMNRISI